MLQQDTSTDRAGGRSRGCGWSQNDILRTNNLSTNEGSLRSLSEELNNESSQELNSGLSNLLLNEGNEGSSSNNLIS